MGRMQYENIAWEDRMTDNSLQCYLLLCLLLSGRSTKNHPPMRLDGIGPYDPDTVVAKAFSAGISMLKRKFFTQMNNSMSGSWTRISQMRKLRSVL